MHNRIQYDDECRLDEVVTDGGAHLENLDDDSWFLSCRRSDGSEFCIWFEGRITLTEERAVPKKGGKKCRAEAF